jgi:hypothetical protein
MAIWWRQPLRAVTLEFPASDIATIDVAGIINECSRGDVNLINVFTTSYWPGGTTFYQSRIAPHYPGLGRRDLLAEAIESGHHNNQKVIAYVASIWGGKELYEAHPDWAQRKVDGSLTCWDEALTTVAMCPSSPYRNYLASVVTEISDNYAVDGFYFDEASYQSWCNCSYCQEKFKAEFGLSLPTRVQWDNFLFHQFLTWRYKQILTWHQDLYNLVKRKDRCVFFQGAFPFAHLTPKLFQVSGLQLLDPYSNRFGVSWYVPMAHGVDLSQSAHVCDLIHFELYRRSVKEPLWWIGTSLRYGQAIGQGKQVLSLVMMAQSPFDLYNLPEAEIRLTVAEIVANSGSPLFARYYPDRVDQDGWKIVYNCLCDIKGLEPYLLDRESIKYVAIVFSQSTLERFDHVSESVSHLGCLKGYSKALLQEHIPFDIITESDLSKHSADYKVLILPNASCLSSVSKKVIKRYIRKGGGVVASFEVGMYDEMGNRTTEDDFSGLFGFRYTNEPLVWSGFDAYMCLNERHNLPIDFAPGRRIPTGGMQINVETTSATVVAEVLGGAAVHLAPISDEPGYSAILYVDSESAGRSVFFTMPIGNRFLEFGVEDHRKLIVAAVQWAARSEPPIRLKNAPQTLAVTAFRKRDGKKIIIHLVDSIRDELAQPISELPEYRDITLQVDLDFVPSKVFRLNQNRELEWSLKDETLSISIPSLKTSSVVIIER